jgi:hypothetical protein
MNSFLQASSNQLSRGLIGPILVHQKIAFGHAGTNNHEWDGFISYSSLASDFTSPGHPSPRYWLLWPGISCMIVVSFTGMCIIPILLGKQSS